MRERVILLAPVMSRLDHVRPALHRLSIIEGKDVDVRLIPLQAHTTPRLEIFCEFMKNQTSFGKLPGNHTVELINTEENFLMSNNWFSNWNVFLHSLSPRLMSETSKRKSLVILLSETIPTGIILASSIATLTIPNVRLIEFPVGYDLNSQGDNFDPSRQIMEQMIEFHTWSGKGIREPISELASKAEVLNVLDVIRSIAENKAILSKDNELNNISREVVKVSEIKDGINSKEFAQDKSKKTTPNMLSNRLKVLRDNSIISKISGKAAYNITETGLVVSGLLSNPNQ